PQLLVEGALVVVARVVLEDVTDVGRVRDQVPVARADFQVHDIAEPARRVCEQSGRTAPDRRQHAEYGQAAWTGWTFGDDHGASPATTALYSLAHERRLVITAAPASAEGAYHLP